MKKKNIIVRGYNLYTGEIFEQEAASKTQAKKAVYNRIKRFIEYDKRYNRDTPKKYYITFEKDYIYATPNENYKSYNRRMEKEIEKDINHYEQLNGADGIRAQRQAILYTI